MSKQYKGNIKEIAEGQVLLYPEEQVAPLKKKSQKLFIGIPRERNEDEKRIPLRPEAVEILVRHGHEVKVESQAGLGAKFEDLEYANAGAMICYHPQEVFESDIVLKIEPLTEEEMGYMRFGKTIISALPKARLTPEYIKGILHKRLIGIAYEYIEDNSGGMPLVRAMSEIAGSTVMLIAAEYLSSVNDGQGIILGGITGVPPTKVVILGGGTVAEYAARTAIGLGAEVKIFDKHLYKLRRIKYALGQQIYTSTLDLLTMSEAISRADVVIGAMRAEKGQAPCVVSEEMVSRMKPNSVLIDVSIDQGGCFETSEVRNLKNPVFRKYGVIHYCVPNIASRVARTSSTALSNIFASYLIETGEEGAIDNMILHNPWFMKGVYAFKGSLTNADIANQFGMAHKDLMLLAAAMR